MGHETDYEHTPHPDAEAPSATEGTEESNTEAAIENADGVVTDGEPSFDAE